MKLLSIILKDITQSFRSVFAVVFMFGIPILVVTMFYFMFGGSPEEENGFQLAPIHLQVVNLDSGDPMFTQGMSAGTQGDLSGSGIDLSQVRSMGDFLVQMLTNENYADILSAVEVLDADQAREAVDDQQAGLAVIIPEDFTRALIDPEETAVVELYQDPTLTLGPGVVKSILNQFLDYSMATKIGLSVVTAQLEAAGLSPDTAHTQSIAMQFLSLTDQVSEPEAGVEIQAIDETEESNPLSAMLGMFMGAMMVLYSFFTGVASTQSILREEQKGTMQRLFTTPTALWTILNGKFLAAALTVLVQVTALLIFSRLVFNVDWGLPLQIGLVIVGIVLCASAFGIFIIAFLKDEKQSGVIFGGVLTTTGMMGICSVFVMNVPSASKITGTLSLFVPQGWAMTSLRMAIESAPMSEFLPVFAGTLAWTAVFLVIGLLRFRKRYA